MPTKLTPIQVRAMQILKDKGPLLTGCAGEEIWPEKQFKNSQGAALAAGGVLGRLRKRELVYVKLRERSDEQGRVWPEGWALTSKGKEALRGQG